MVVNILLVDDDKDWVEDTVGSLKKRAYNVKSFTNADEALEFMKTNYFDILLVDYKLLNGSTRFEDGLQLLNEIRKFDKIIPVILVSGQIEKSDIEAEDVYEKAIHLGVDEYLKKGYGIDEIIRVINKVENTKVNYFIDVLKKRKQIYGGDSEFFTTSTGEKYTIDDIFNEIRKGTDLGKEISKNLANFVIDVARKNSIE